MLLFWSSNLSLQLDEENSRGPVDNSHILPSVLYSGRNRDHPPFFIYSWSLSPVTIFLWWQHTKGTEQSRCCCKDFYCCVLFPTKIQLFQKFCICHKSDRIILQLNVETWNTHFLFLLFCTKADKDTDDNVIYYKSGVKFKCIMWCAANTLVQHSVDMRGYFLFAWLCLTGFTDTKCFWQLFSDLQTDLSAFCVVLFLIRIEELGQTEVCDLDVVRSLDEDVSRRQVAVYQVTLLEVVHALLSNKKRGTSAYISISHGGKAALPETDRILTRSVPY